MSDIQNDKDNEQIAQLLYRRGLLSWNIEQFSLELQEVNQALKQLTNAKQQNAKVMNTNNE